MTVYLESSRSTLESTCRRLVEMASSEKILNFSLADFFLL